MYYEMKKSKKSNSLTQKHTTHFIDLWNSICVIIFEDILFTFGFCKRIHIKYHEQVGINADATNFVQLTTPFSILFKSQISNSMCYDG